MSTPPVSSLRERKRLETWSALHEAAARMALSHEDLHQVTVEAIASAANVSPRTFFNYFNSKEDAVLGLHDPVLDEAATARFADVGEDDLLESVVHLLVSVVYGCSSRAEARERRAEVLGRYPELAHRQFSHFMKVEQLVSQVVANRLRASPRWHTDRIGTDTDQAAQMVVMLAGAAMRMAMRQTLAAPTAEDERTALERAVSLLREVTRKIS